MQSSSYVELKSANVTAPKAHTRRAAISPSRVVCAPVTSNSRETRFYCATRPPMRCVYVQKGGHELRAVVRRKSTAVRFRSSQNIGETRSQRGVIAAGELQYQRQKNAGFKRLFLEREEDVPTTKGKGRAVVLCQPSNFATG